MALKWEKGWHIKKEESRQHQIVMSKWKILIWYDEVGKVGWIQIVQDLLDHDTKF